MLQRVNRAEIMNDCFSYIQDVKVGQRVEFLFKVSPDICTDVKRKVLRHTHRVSSLSWDGMFESSVYETQVKTIPRNDVTCCVQNGCLKIPILDEDIFHNCPESCCGTNCQSNLNKWTERQQKHANRHIKETYACPECPRTFKSKFGCILHHKNKHTITFKYICDICNHGFNQKLQLRYHLTSHTNSLKEKCGFCKETFYSKSSLKRHHLSCKSTSVVKDHHNKRFVCEICGAYFKQNYSLQYHIKGKHGTQVYSCPECDKKFPWRSSLYVHLKTHRKESQQGD